MKRKEVESAKIDLNTFNVCTKNVTLEKRATKKTYTTTDGNVNKNVITVWNQ